MMTNKFEAHYYTEDRKLDGIDVERLLTTPQENYEDVTVVDQPTRGYLLADGSWLDLAGQDHRFINGMVTFDKRTEEKFGTGSPTKKMLYIMKMANLIRYIPEGKSLQIITKPTRSQIREIWKLCEDRGKINIEFGINTDTKEYTSGNLEELEEDLKNYNGEE